MAAWRSRAWRRPRGHVVGGHQAVSRRRENERGLLVKFGTEEQRVPVRAALPAQVTGTFDLVFLAVKSQYREDALTQILPHLTPQSAVVSLQNGVNEPHIAKRVGAERTIGCLVDVSSDCIAPGEIQRGRQGNFFVGEMDGRMTPRLEEIRRLLAHSVPAYARTNIMGSCGRDLQGHGRCDDRARRHQCARTARRPDISPDPHPSAA